MIGVYIYTNIFSVLVSELFPDLQSPNTSSASPIHQHHITRLGSLTALSRPGSVSGHPLCLSRATRMLAAWRVSPRGVTQYPSSSLELVGFLEDSYPNPNSYYNSYPARIDSSTIEVRARVLISNLGSISFGKGMHGVGIGTYSLLYAKHQVTIIIERARRRGTHTYTWRYRLRETAQGNVHSTACARGAPRAC